MPRKKGRLPPHPPASLRLRSVRLSIHEGPAIFSPVRRLLALSIPLALLARRSAGDEGLSRVELSKKGKAATALVELKARKAYGTAFCVHSSGLFLTNEHVVRGEGGVAGINLILEPGQKTQKALSAKVIRAGRCGGCRRRCWS